MIHSRKSFVKHMGKEMVTVIEEADQIQKKESFLNLHEDLVDQEIAEKAND